MSKAPLACVSLFFALCIFSCSKPDQQNGQRPTSPPPSTDTVIHVTGVTVDPTEFILLPTMTWQLTATISPANAANKNVTWSTSDTSVATVNLYGTVTAKSVGTAVITVASIEKPSVNVTTKVTVLRTYDVYAVGQSSFPGAQGEAKYWKNGAGVPLNGGYGNVGAQAFAVTLVGNDVYIAGTTLNSSLNTIPTYWKNGVAHIVGDVSLQYNSFIRGIAVSGSAVYVTGYTFYDSQCPAYCNGKNAAAYWVDDGTVISRVPLVDGTSSTMAHGIVLSGGDVIVAGSQANDNFYRWSTTWKNVFSNVSILSPATGFYEAMAITTHGTDIFYAGYGGCANFGCNATAYVWKNDMVHTIPLTDGSVDAQATCLAFTGDTLYVGGYRRNASGRKIATYWRVVNGQVSAPRSLSNGVNDATVNGIAAVGNDIFAVGMDIPSGGGPSAIGWRAYEGYASPLFLDLTGYYVPYGNYAWGIYVR